MVKVTEFSGGLSTRIDPTLIHPNNSQTLINADIESGLIKSFKDIDTSNTASPACNDYAYLYGTTWISSDTERSYVRFEGKLYMSQVGGVAKELSTTGGEVALGIDAPDWDTEAGFAIDGDLTSIFSLSVERSYGGDRLINVRYSASNYPKEHTVYFVRDNKLFTFGTHTLLDAEKPTAGTNDAWSFNIILDPGHVGTTVQYVGLGPAIYLMAERVSSADNTATFIVREAGRSPGVTTGVRPVIQDFGPVDDAASRGYDAAAVKAGVTIPDLTVDHYYAFTYYNTLTGVESAPYIKKASALHESPMRIWGIPPKSPYIIRIYRLSGNLTDYYFVTDTSGAPNTTQYKYDFVPETALGDALTTLSDLPPESGLHSLVEHRSIMFGALGNEVLFSRTGKPYAWPAENSISFESDVKGLLPTPQGLLMFTEEQVYLLTGSSPTNFARGLVGKEGCTNGASCQLIKNTPFWISRNGLCTLANGTLSVISWPFLGNVNIPVKQTVVYDNQYFILKNDGSFLVYDFRVKPRFYNLKFSAVVTGVHVSGGVFYCVVHNKVYPAFTGADLEFEYTSPLFVEGNHSEVKFYNNIYIRAKGTFEVKIYIDEVLVSTQSITGDKTFELTPPVDKSRGYNCNLGIKGKGTIYSIDTTPMRRQNGR